MGDEQYVNIENYEKKHGIPVHYLLYNPLVIPFDMSFPVAAPGEVGGDCQVGCRVVPSGSLRAMIKQLKTDRPPKYADVATQLACPFSEGKNVGGWRLESYIVDELLACKNGLIDESPQYRHLSHIFSQKTQPIHAALVITFEMPSLPS